MEPDQQVEQCRPARHWKQLSAKIKQYDNSVTSVTGDFVMETTRRPGESSKDEYSLTLKGEKVQIGAWKERRAVNVPLIEYWDGEQLLGGRYTDPIKDSLWG